MIDGWGSVLLSGSNVHLLRQYGRDYRLEATFLAVKPHFGGFGGRIGASSGPAPRLRVCHWWFANLKLADNHHQVVLRQAVCCAICKD